MSVENMNRRKIYLPLIISVSIVVGILLGSFLTNRIQSGRNSTLMFPSSGKLNNILQYIEEEYVDTVSSDRLTESAIVSMLKELDPHSAYIPASELQAVTDPLEGNFSGIGVQFNMQNDTVVIMNTVPNGPSALLGIQAGDRIVKVNDTVVAGVKMESDAIVRKLKGPRGTKVQVSILRPGNKKPILYEITRDIIPLNSVDVAYMVTPKTGYIKINQFARTTPEEFVKAVTNLRNLGMQNLVVDLRGNGGGYLDAAINLADQFLPEGRLIVYTKGRAKARENFTATYSGVCEGNEIAILIDELSASASEILAGAIQDNDRGTIIGRRSFGKGLVQEQIPLSDGSALRLTVARYYTPSGRCIQKPYHKGDEDYFLDITKRYQHGEFENKDSIKLNDSLKYTTLKGRVVYGGGGIMPDIFVPLDTAGFSRFYEQIRSNGLIYRFSFKYSDNNRQRLKSIANLDALRKYLREDKVFMKFIDFASEQGVKASTRDIEVSKKYISTELEAFIARYFFDDEGFYPIIGEIDNTLSKAIEVLEKK
ncbi:MAG TPA: S41 family peptidase [Bacteroidales bacterium]|nr:S41 family peptidase [Bacteroidales bacterium]